MDNAQENRIAVIGIIVEDTQMAESVNSLLHQYGSYIVGRMGVPYREKGVSVLCVVLDAPNGDINALTGKIGSLPGVSAKTLFSKY